MLNADRLPPGSASSFWTPQRKAWAVMLAAFLVFCTLTTTTAITVYRYAAAPRPRSVIAQVVQPDAAFLQPADLIRAERLPDGQVLSVGDRVTTSDTARAGIVARLQNEGGTIALWPASYIAIEARDRESLRYRLEQGQILVDLQGEDRSLYVAVRVHAQEIELKSPGRYRVRVLSGNQITTAIAERNLAPAVEIATDSGLAMLGEATIEPGRRLLVGDGLRPALGPWYLVRDGNFNAFSSSEYLATLHDRPEVRRSDTWIITQQPQSTGAFWRNGLFYLINECTSPDGNEDCRKYARLARLGGNEKDSITAIAQAISADVSSYRNVTLEADVRIDYQSLSKGGADGTECPLFARVDYANAEQSNLQQVFCFWAFDHGQGEISRLPYIHSTQIAPKTWYNFQVNLSERIPELRVIEQLIFYSNGHDYDAGVTNVSLRAEGLAEARQP